MARNSAQDDAPKSTRRDDQDGDPAIVGGALTLSQLIDRLRERW